MTAPKTGECYCGCGTPTEGHFEGGHDLKATAMLHFVKYGTTSMAAILREEGFGPEGENLVEKAKARGYQRLIDALRG
jgi:hypothetical protein